MIKNALIAGATGLIGRELISLLIKTDYYNSIHVLSRRPYLIEHAKIHNHSINFNQLPTLKTDAIIRDVYVCLGTTLKKAGSIENFRKVDLDYVVELANWAKSNRVERFAVVSSIGADISKRNYYLRTKGEMEEELKSRVFDHLVILRPSLLLGKRDETRVAEQFGKFVSIIISPLLFGNLKKYKPVKASDVARNMFISTINADQSVRVIENDQIIGYN
jgi:uncharacterized protein YbjT (DUF2867 family)